MADLTTSEAPASTAAPTDITAAPASTAVVTEPKQETKETVTPEGTTDTPDFESIEDMSQLESILEGANDPELEKKKPAQKQEEQKEKPPEETQKETKADQTQTPPENTEETNLDATREFAKNYRFRTENPQMQQLLTLIRQNPDANPIDLAIQAGWKPKDAAAAAEATKEQQQEQVTQQPDIRIEDAKAKVAKLKAELKDAETNFAPTAEILDQLQDAKLDLRQAEQEVQAETQAAQSFNAQAAEAEAQAVKLAPETGKPGTPQFEEVQREVAFLESQNSPILGKPDYALRVLERVQQRRPDLFPKAKPPVTATMKEQTPPKQQARPTGEVESPAATSQPTTLTSEQAARKIDELSLEELQALADQTGEKRR